MWQPNWPETWNAKGKPSQKWLKASGNQSWVCWRITYLQRIFPVLPWKLPFWWLIMASHFENTHLQRMFHSFPSKASNFPWRFPLSWSPASRSRYADLRRRIEILLQHPTPMCLGRSWPRFFLKKNIENLCGGFLKWGYPNSWMVYKGKSH